MGAYSSAAFDIADLEQILEAPETNAVSSQAPHRNIRDGVQRGISTDAFK